ncbi:MAG: hypothetical protein ACRD8Z_02020 [Nitrososphaeraceae archaeon]
MYIVHGEAVKKNDIETFVKNLLKGVDSEIQKMDERNVNSINKVKVRQQLMDVLKGQTIDPNLLKVTPEYD